MACSAVYCNSRTTIGGVKDPRLTFHTFPKCPEVRREWIKAVRRDKWEPTKYNRLCSKHFEKSCYIAGLSLKKLKSDAVPTIFEGYPRYYQPKVKKRKLPQRRDGIQHTTPRKRKKVQDFGVETRPSYNTQVSTQTIRRRLNAIARKKANAEARERERGKSFVEARKGRQEAGTSSKNIDESADDIETLSNASFEDDTSDSDNETSNSQAFKPTSKVGSTDQKSNPQVAIAIGRKKANAEARKPGKSFSKAKKGQQKAGTSQNFDESANDIETLSNASFEDNMSDSDNETINSQAFKPTSKISSKDEKSYQQVEKTTKRNVDYQQVDDITMNTQAIEPTSNASSKDETSNPDMETLDTKALKVTLARIRANPQLYIGIPKNCYHLIDIMHKQTEIPTTHILLCLKKIKLDTHIEELADQFGITADEASDIFISNVPALANILHTFVDNYDLQIPRSLHSSCVIDSLEINVQPSSNNSSELTQTERGNIVKYVVCCTPDGYINYVSPGYGGRQSDDRLLEDTNYLDRLKSGDSVMPNGLRNVESLILQKGLKVVKPRVRQKHTASLRATQHSTNNESQLSEDQVKRLVQRIREFTMVRDRSVLSCDLVRVLDEAVVISCALINLQSFVIN